MTLLTASDRRTLERHRKRLIPIVANYDENGIHDTIYHSDLARIEAALEKDRQGQQVKRGKENKHGTSKQ